MNQQEARTLCTGWDTPVRVKAAALANLLAWCGILSWQSGRRRPERPWPVRLLVGVLSTAVLLVADLALGAAAATASIALATRRRWLLALGLTAGGAIAVAATRERDPLARGGNHKA